MRKKTIGKTGIEVSEIAFGGVEIGMPYGMRVKSSADMLTEQEAIKLLYEALGRGINFFDTARLYGESERIIGLAFEGKRQQVVITSKCRHLRLADGSIVPTASLDRFIRSSLVESLKALRTDYIDLYMIHYADGAILDNDNVSRIFSDLKKEGLVRTIGVSVYKPQETMQAIEAGVWDAIQLPFNLMDQSHGKYFGKAVEKGVGVIVRSVLMRGMLTDGLEKLHPALATVEKHIDRYRSFLAGGYEGLSQLAMKFALAHEAVSSVLVGIDKQRYLIAALAAVAGEGMDGALCTELQGMGYPKPDFLNLAEWDKNGWL